MVGGIFLLLGCYILAATADGDSQELSEAEIQAICRGASVPPGFSYGYMGKAKCSRQFYQCTQEHVGFSIVVRTCAPGTVWDNEAFACVHPYQSSEGCTTPSCTGEKYKDYNFCNRYRECEAGDVITSKCCPPGEVWEEETLDCTVNPGADCVMDSSCPSADTTTPSPSTTTSTSQNGFALCRPYAQPFFVGDTASCDRYIGCPWIGQPPIYKCCPPTLVWDQKVTACNFPTAADEGCTRLCVEAFPECKVSAVTVCLPLTDSIKDESVNKYYIKNDSVKLATVDNKKGACFPPTGGHLKLPGSMNFWNNKEPKELDISLEFYIADGSDSSTNWIPGSYSYLLTNDGDDYDGTFGMYVTLDDVVEGVARYFLVAYIGSYTVQAQRYVYEGEWNTAQLVYDGRVGKMNIILNGDTDSITTSAETVRNCKGPVYIGNSVCNSGEFSPICMRQIKLIDKNHISS